VVAEQGLADDVVEGAVHMGGGRHANGEHAALVRIRARARAGARAGARARARARVLG
jgi:hypothetical protein